MGGGVSSLSKICVVGPPSRPDADVDYTFAQIGSMKPVVDYAGKLRQHVLAIGPSRSTRAGALPPDGEATVRIHNTNTSKIIVARFRVQEGRAVVAGDLAIDGVAGPGRRSASLHRSRRIQTGSLLPTGHAVDVFDLPGTGRIQASLVDAGNPASSSRRARCGLPAPSCRQRWSATRR